MLPDIQATKDTRGIDIDQVGVSDLRYPIHVTDRDGKPIRSWDHDVGGIRIDADRKIADAAPAAFAASIGIKRVCNGRFSWICSLSSERSK